MKKKKIYIFLCLKKKIYLETGFNHMKHIFFPIYFFDLQKNEGGFLDIIF